LSSTTKIAVERKIIQLTFDAGISYFQEHVQSYWTRFGLLQIGVRYSNLALFLSRTFLTQVAHDIRITTQETRMQSEVEVLFFQTPADVSSTIDSAFDDDDFIFQALWSKRLQQAVFFSVTCNVSIDRQSATRPVGTLI
jgi:hypothetical protein